MPIAIPAARQKLIERIAAAAREAKKRGDPLKADAFVSQYYRGVAEEDFDADFAWTHARFDNGERIPNAIDRVASVAATLREFGPWSATLQMRYLGPGALIEDNSVRSFSSVLTNLRVSRKLGTNAELTLDVFNLFDREVNDIQYFYDSQLPGEAGPVADRHVHPAEPRSARLTLQVRF